MERPSLRTVRVMEALGQFEREKVYDLDSWRVGGLRTWTVGVGDGGLRTDVETRLKDN